MSLKCANEHTELCLMYVNEKVLSSSRFKDCLGRLGEGVWQFVHALLRLVL